VSDIAYDIITMSQREKLLIKWRDNPPKEEEVETVESILKYYGIPYSIPDHIVLDDDRLGSLQGVRGGVTIPFKGHKVKGYYLKRLVRVLEALGVYEEIDK
jgi:hypothetical protein